MLLYHQSTKSKKSATPRINVPLSPVNLATIHDVNTHNAAVFSRMHHWTRMPHTVFSLVALFALSLSYITRSAGG